MARNIMIALRSFLAPLGAARALRRSLLLSALLLVLLFGVKQLGFVPDAVFREMRKFIVLPGLPLFAALLGELALRDGITYRTLLYPLLGPVSRPMLAVVRTLATGLLLFAIAGALLTLVVLIGGMPSGSLPRELFGMLLAAPAYAALAGLLHLFNRRGAIIFIAIFMIFDYPISHLPFSFRNVAPAYHLGSLTGHLNTLALPLELPLTAQSTFVSAAFLIAVTAVCVTLLAWAFARRRLISLC
jgi:hypothetical protein